MIRSILVVARHPGFLLGMSQALLKFGYQVMTAPPETANLEQASQMQPSLVILHPPTGSDERRRCLDMVRIKFLTRGIQVLVCVATADEAATVQELMRGAQVLTGSPLRLNDLYARLQTLFDMVRRRELRINAELAVAHREPGLYEGDFYYYDTITSLSVGGCFVRTQSPYTVGTRIELVFCAGNAARSIRAHGKVCHHGQGAPGATPQGMGIQFDDLSDADRAAVESFLMSQVSTPDLPATL